MLGTCAVCEMSSCAFVSPSIPGLSPTSTSKRCTQLRVNKNILVGQTRSRRLRMTARSPDDVPSDAPDPADKLLDMDLLRKRMSDVDRKARDGFRPSDAVIDLSALSSENMGLEEIDDEEFLNQFDTVSSLWVIVFTSTADGSEGVYSLSIGEESIVLAFEDRQEAQRYSLSLEAQEFPSPQVCELDAEELQSFCRESGLRLGFVPKGSLITPPEESAIDDLDKWRGKPSNREGKDSMGLSEEDIEIMKKRLDKLFGI